MIWLVHEITNTDVKIEYVPYICQIWEQKLNLNKRHWHLNFLEEYMIKYWQDSSKEVKQLPL